MVVAGFSLQNHKLKLATTTTVMINNNMNREIIAVLVGLTIYTLIARRIRENKVYCEIFPYSISIDKLKELNLKGIVLSGGPASVYDKNAPRISKEFFL